MIQLTNVIVATVVASSAIGSVLAVPAPATEAGSFQRVAREDVDLETRAPRRGGRPSGELRLKPYRGPTIEQMHQVVREDVYVEARTPRRGGRTSGEPRLKPYRGPTIEQMHQVAREEDIDLQTRDPRRGGRASGEPRLKPYRGPTIEQMHQAVREDVELEARDLDELEFVIRELYDELD